MKSKKHIDIFIINDRIISIHKCARCIPAKKEKVASMILLRLGKDLDKFEESKQLRERIFKRWEVGSR